MPFKKKKTVPIKYTSRDFTSIKRDLVEYARRYYPETYKDFNEGSFGSLTLDSVAYVGDILSFYLDYQANESFLTTAIEYDNILKLGRQMGYRYRVNQASTGQVAFFISVSADSNGIEPNRAYLPVLKSGTLINSQGGGTYTLIEDVDFSNPNNQTVVGSQNATTGLPTKYIIKAYGQVVSGQLQVTTKTVGGYQKFLSIQIDDSHVTEIVSVIDSDGHPYYEVDYLSQNVVYVPVTNKSSDKYKVPFIMKPLAVPRRYIFEQNRDQSFLQFGYGSEDNLSNEVIVDPSKIILDVHGRDYITDKSFDPSRLIETDKLGVVPANTELTIVYRRNTSETVNAGVNALNSISGAQFVFENAPSLDDGTMGEVTRSLECTNETSILGSVALPTSQEVKERAYSSFASQNRAVTKEDYVSLAYNMPPRFGAIKRCSIVRDANSNKRNLNMYVLSENDEGFFVESPQALKNNLKTWLSRHKMINDTIDILDGRVINIGINFEAISDIELNKYEVLARAKDALVTRMMRISYDMGEPFRITDVFNILKNVEGILDVTKVEITSRIGGNYSTFYYSIETNTSPDRRMVLAPNNGVFEIKYPNIDIVGTIL